MDLKSMLRRHMPSAYRTAVHLKHGQPVESIRRTRSRARGRRIFEARGPVTVDVCASTGLGGILTHTGKALCVAREYGVDIGLRFSSPLYAPSWGAVDWLEAYFTRLGPTPNDELIIESLDVPGLQHTPSMGDMSELVWSSIRIHDDIVTHADLFAGTESFAAVHYRGSDKYLEAPRVETAAVLDATEREMTRHGLNRLFVATDEPVFVSQAVQRFGSAVFSLPLEAVSTADGKPSHFTNVDGEIKAREALTTMVILSRSKVMVKTESLLSDWAATLATDQKVVLVNRP